jgi:CHAT domain-containing protein
LTLDSLAFLYVIQGRYDEAESLYKRSLAIVETVANPDQQLSISLDLDYLASLYFYEGRYAEAEPLYKRALAIEEKALGTNDPDLMTDITSQSVRQNVFLYVNGLGNLGALYYVQGRYAEAEPLDKRALAIHEKLLGPDPNNLNNLGTLYRVQGRYAEAEPFLKHALEIREKSQFPENPVTANSLNNLALLYRLQGRYAESLPLYKRALAINEKAFGPEHPDVAWSLNGLADVYREQGRYATALPLIRRAAAITAERAASPKENTKGGQSELRSLRIVFLDEASVTAHLIAANNPQSAQLREEGFEALQWSKASDTAAAVAHMAARFAAGSDDLANLVRQRQDMQDRFDATEAAILKTASEPTDKPDATAEAELRTDADSLHQKLKQLDDELAAKFPRYAELANPKPITITDIQNLLASDQALITFAIGDKESYVAVVTSKDYAIHIAPVGAKALAEAVKQLRASLDPSDALIDKVSKDPSKLPEILPFAATTAYRLYQQLLAPAEAQLEGVNQLYVVTDGALESLPLGVLLTAPPQSGALTTVDGLRKAPWLAKRYAVSVLPSVSSLKSLRQFTATARDPFFGIGDPILKDHAPSIPMRGGPMPVAARGANLQAVFRGATVDVAALRDLPSLPETADELRAEAKLFKADLGNSLMIGPQATVTAVRQANLVNRRVIAFATHGLVANAGYIGNTEPGLVMTPPTNPTPEDDGLLKASDIAQLKLNADLVILSACNTAASDGTPGAEGLSGLAKAFLYAGTRSLLVSNWEVSSDATVALMTSMATQLETKGASRAEALKRAELDLMQHGQYDVYAHPLFWAPFVLVGEGGANKE